MPNILLTLLLATSLLWYGDSQTSSPPQEFNCTTSYAQCEDFVCNALKFDCNACPVGTDLCYASGSYDFYNKNALQGCVRGIVGLSNSKDELNNKLTWCQGNLTNYKNNALSLQSNIDTLNNNLTTCNQTLAERDQYITALNNNLTTCNQTLEERDQSIITLNLNLTTCNQTLAERDQYITALNNNLTTCNQTLAERDQSISTLNNNLTKCNQDLLYSNIELERCRNMANNRTQVWKINIHMYGNVLDMDLGRKDEILLLTDSATPTWQKKKLTICGDNRKFKGVIITPPSIDEVVFCKNSFVKNTISISNKKLKLYEVNK